MKCPKCGFTSYDHLENCKRCNTPLNPKGLHGHHSLKSKSRINQKGADRQLSASDLKDDLTLETERQDLSPEDESDFLINHDRFQDVFDKLEKFKTDENKSSHETLVLEDSYGFADRIKDFIYTWVPSGNPAAADNDKTALSYDLAGIWPRLGAFIIDWTIVTLLTSAVFVAGLRQIDVDYTYNPGALFSILIKVYLLLLFFASSYFLFLTAYCGKTVGKLLFGIEIVKKSGVSPGYYDCAKRWIFSIISILPFFAGYLIAIFSEDKQGLHDRIADTVVVNTGNKNDFRTA